ncbi:hypothetical protein FB45DRAFT_929304 [Roridomyces roridus]|uniref:F-box domain-containing protein n=1 Tax=Roridomyces roridus TaxID=1738132 RepID=A0AAD7BIH1_9AGAR|nr:hypothetical protein FB45DRAFT_929304 [Roridomyces roridus]
MNYYHQAFSPIASLPVELLAYIFVLGTHEPVPPDVHDDECQPFNAESVKTPLVYASVSRLWRNVALNTPALYTSLCITPNLVRDVGVLDVSPISTYLQLSCNYLVDILIDARDHDWDFEDESCYKPLFSTENMSAALGVLLPHIGRWRSLSILTDVYSPMHAALRPLEACLAANGAPHLESLRLMRCDSYAAHASFSPVSNPHHVFLSSIRGHGGASLLLPNLRYLSLRGVPAAWEPLASVLPDCLQSLELAYHPVPTQPTISELQGLLASTPRLSRLVVNGSGPVLFDPISASPASSSHDLWLPELRDLTLGYVSAPTGLAFLQLLSAAAPNVRALHIEDASDPASLTPVDASPLLAALTPSNLESKPFPHLAALELKRTHLAGSPLQHPPEVPHLELVGMDSNALAAVRCTDTLCVKGGKILSSPAQLLCAVLIGKGQDAEQHRPLRVLEMHGSTFATPGAVPVEDFVAGGTRVRVFRDDADEEDGMDEDGDEDEDTLMGSDREEEEAFKPGGVFNDPVFDARYAGYGGMIMAVS